MSRVDKRVDGISVTNWTGRFTGTIPLEEEEANALGLDETVVLVTVGSVKDVQAKIDKDGDITRVNVVKVTDARLVQGELRDVLVERLGLWGTDTAAPAQPDSETGEIKPLDDPVELYEDEEYDGLGLEDEVFELPKDGTAVVGHIKAGAGDARLPNVLPFDKNEGPVASLTGGEVVGRIGRSDNSLRTFLDAEVA